MAPAQSVARAVVKAVSKDGAELVIQPGPDRLLRAVPGYFPGLRLVLNRAAGIDATLRTLNEQPDTHAAA